MTVFRSPGAALKPGRSWFLLAICAAMLFSGHLAAQSDSVVVTAGRRYEAGRLQRVLLGAKHRDLWTTPIRVELLNLRKFAGGLTPKRGGGGKQTRSLRFEGADGREYTFRSVDKNQRTGLSRVRRVIMGDIRQDQVSALHPAAALVADPLLDAAGVLHASPRLVVMPNAPALGPYRKEFAGMLGIIEEHPNEGPDDTPGFAGSRDIVGTEDLWERLRENPRERVDTRAYLTARLMDVFLGDWDRHADQWRWAWLERGSDSAWVPIPRDRDYALSDYDGLLPGVARPLDSKIVRFDGTYRDLEGLLVKARKLDRRFLCGLSYAVWDSTAIALQQRLTDDVIARAVHRMPREYVQRSGNELYRTLLSRRNHLRAAARGYYRDLHSEQQCG